MCWRRASETSEWKRARALGDVEVEGSEVEVSVEAAESSHALLRAVFACTEHRGGSSSGWAETHQLCLRHFGTVVLVQSRAEQSGAEEQSRAKESKAIDGRPAICADGGTAHSSRRRRPPRRRFRSPPPPRNAPWPIVTRLWTKDLPNPPRPSRCLAQDRKVTSRG